jgi:hypothetical protein
MKQYKTEIELEIDGTEYGWFVVEAEVEAYETDASFSHEFGIRKDVGLVIYDIDILSVMDEDATELPIRSDMKDLIEDRVTEHVTEKWQRGELD